MEDIVDKKYELFDGVFANKEQKEAIDLMDEFLSNPIKDERDSFTLIGKGGTGKTTIIKKVIERHSTRNYCIAAAPSHAAKNVLTRSLGDSVDEVTTLASLLGMKLNLNTGRFEIDDWARREFGIPIETAEILIIDECSMIGEELYKLIRDHKSKNCKIIYLGDHRQLPPIRSDDNSMFRDKNSPTFDVPNRSYLKERMRQGEESPIVPITDVYADNIENIDNKLQIKDNPLLKDLRVTNYDREKDEGVIFTKDYDRAIYNLSLDLQTEEAKEDINYVRALVYTNAARHYINEKIRNYIWKEKSIEQFVVGEKVIAFDNYATPEGRVVMQNSDVFSVKKVEKAVHRRGYNMLRLHLKGLSGEVIKVPVIHNSSIRDFNQDVQDFMNNRQYKKGYELKQSVADVQYGYAITAYKAQGSTYRNAYVFEDNIMRVKATTAKTKNQSMYVATSRPQKKLVIISDLN